MPDPHLYPGMMAGCVAQGFTMGFQPWVMKSVETFRIYSWTGMSPGGLPRPDIRPSD